MLITYFFIMDSALSDSDPWKTMKEYIDKNTMAFQFIGVYNPKEVAQWKLFFPYVTLFVLSVILWRLFRDKI